MINIESNESLDDIFISLVDKLNISDKEKTELVESFDIKSLSEKIVMIKVIENKVQQQEKEIESQFNELKKR